MGIKRAYDGISNKLYVYNIYIYIYGNHNGNIRGIYNQWDCNGDIVGHTTNTWIRTGLSLGYNQEYGDLI